MGRKVKCDSCPRMCNFSSLVLYNDKRLCNRCRGKKWSWRIMRWTKFKEMYQYRSGVKK